MRKRYDSTSPQRQCWRVAPDNVAFEGDLKLRVSLLDYVGNNVRRRQVDQIRQSILINTAILAEFIVHLGGGARVYGAVARIEVL